MEAIGEEFPEDTNKDMSSSSEPTKSNAVVNPPSLLSISSPSSSSPILPFPPKTHGEGNNTNNNSMDSSCSSSSTDLRYSPLVQKTKKTPSVSTRPVSHRSLEGLLGISKDTDIALFFDQSSRSHISLSGFVPGPSAVNNNNRADASSSSADAAGATATTTATTDGVAALPSSTKNASTVTTAMAATNYRGCDGDQNTDGDDNMITTSMIDPEFTRARLSMLLDNSSRRLIDAGREGGGMKKGKSKIKSGGKKDVYDDDDDDNEYDEIYEHGINVGENGELQLRIDLMRQHSFANRQKNSAATDLVTTTTTKATTTDPPSHAVATSAATDDDITMTETPNAQSMTAAVSETSAGVIPEATSSSSPSSLSIPPVPSFGSMMSNRQLSLVRGISDASTATTVTVTGGPGALSSINNGRTNLEEIAIQFEHSVSVRDRWYRFKQYSQCFVGSEAVNFLVRSQLAHSRHDAVDLGRRLASEFHLFEHVTNDHEFQDRYLFYRFTDIRDRLSSIPSSHLFTETIGSVGGSVLSTSPTKSTTTSAATRKESIDAEIQENNHQKTTKDKDDTKKSSSAIAIAIRKGSKGARLNIGILHSKNVDSIGDVGGDSSGGGGVAGGDTSNSGAASSNEFSNSTSSASKVLEDIARTLRSGINVRHRMYHLRTYKNCFVASEAVDFMIQRNMANSRGEAVELGRLLARELHLWHHVTNDHEFADDYLFFRFSSGSFLYNDGDDEDEDSSSFLAETQPLALGLSPAAIANGLFAGRNDADGKRNFLEGGIRLRTGLQQPVHQHLTDDEDESLISFPSAASNDNPSPHASVSGDSSSSNSKKSRSRDKRSIESLIEIGVQLRRLIHVKDHFYRMQRYRKCFVASDAVDMMVQTGLAKSRKEAVDLGRQLQYDAQLWRPVTRRKRKKQQKKNPNEFQDDFIFFKFLQDPNDAFASSSESASSSNSSSVPLHRRRDSGRVSLGSITEYDVSGDGDTILASTDFSLTPSNDGDQKNIEPPASSLIVVQDKTLSEIAMKLRKGIYVKNRTYHFKTYRQCFIASEAVDFMIQSRLVTSRQEGVDLGKRLEREMELWHHVTRQHEFEDSYLFFRFSSSTDALHGSVSDITSAYGGGGRRGGGSTLGKSTTSSSIFSSFTESVAASVISDRSVLMEMAGQFRKGIQVQDVMYRLKTYKKVFIGCEAVDFLVQSRMASSREEAVELGRQLSDDLALFHHVKKEHPFKDEYLFYRFSAALEGGLESTMTSSEDLSDSIHDGTEHELLSIASSKVDMPLQEVASQLRNNVRVQNRSHQFKVYRNCFIGSEAVDFLVQSRIASSREMAVTVCRRLMAEMDFLVHVNGDHDFKDEYLFYRFKTIDRSASTVDSIAKSVTSSISEFRVPLQHERLQLEGAFEHEKESAILKNALQVGSTDDDCMDKAQVIFVHGPDGSGKSSLVSGTFQEQGSTTHVYANAKFVNDMSIPFRALRDLFGILCKRLHVSQFRDDCQIAVDEQFADSPHLREVIVQWVPDSALFFPDIPIEEIDLNLKKMSNEKLAIVQLAIVTLLSAVSSVCTVVLHLDDIMWAEMYSQSFLGFLLSNRELTSNVIFCLTYHYDKEFTNDQFHAWKRDVEKHGCAVDIELHDLTLEEMTLFLSNTLRLDDEELGELPQIMLERTNGNLYYVVQLMESLQDLGFIFFDYINIKWAFLIDSIKKETSITDNVGALVVSKIEQLSRSVQQVLKLGSCFGSTINLQVVKKCRSILYIASDVETCLQEACRSQLMIQVSEKHYKYAHEQVLAAAYKMLPRGSERKKIHWEIGCRLLATRLKDDDFLFACVDQLRKGRQYLQDSLRTKVADVSLAAGYRAAHFSAFTVASGYFKFGIDALGEGGFTDHHERAVDLHSSYAETLQFVGDMAESRRTAQLVLSHAVTDEEKYAPSLTLLLCYSSEFMFEESVEWGTSLLFEKGIRIPDNFTTPIVRNDIDKARKRIKKMTDDDLLSLPPMTDAKMEFCLNIMVLLVHSALSLGRVRLAEYVIGQMVLHTLDNGFCKWTPIILVYFGHYLNSALGDLLATKRFTQLAISMQNTFPSDREGDVLQQASVVLTCVEPLSKAMYVALNAHKVSMQNGNIDVACNACLCYAWTFFHSGLPFAPLMEDIEKFSMQMMNYKRKGIVYILPLWQALLNLSGQTSDPLNLETGEAIEKRQLLGAETKNFGQETITSYRMQLSFYFDDISVATECYESLKDVQVAWLGATVLYHVRIYFFALICIECFRRTSKRQYKTDAKKYIDILRDFAEKGAVNVVHKVQILDAEYTSISATKRAEALSKYQKAIVFSSRTGFLQDGGLSNYLCAKYCLRFGINTAPNYLVQACEHYESWGASAISDSIKRRYGSIFSDPTLAGARARPSGGLRSRSHFQESITEVHTSLEVARHRNSITSFEEQS